MHRSLAAENAYLRAQLRRRDAEHASFQMVGEALAQDLSLRQVLTMAAEETRKLTNAQGGSVFLVENDEWLRIAVVVVGDGPVPPIEGMQVPLARSLAGLVVRTGRPRISHDTTDDPRLSHEVVESSQAHSLLIAPLKVKNHSIGAISVANKLKGRFGPSDLRIATLFASQAAIAIENARLRERAKDLAAAEERNRLAREIHDTLVQSLTAIALHLEAAEEVLDSDGARARQNVARALSMARGSLDEARRSITDLRGGPAAGLSAADGFWLLVHQFEQDTGINVHFDGAQFAHALPRNVAAALHRILQESLANVRKHAAAQSVSVNIGLDGPNVHLIVEDDGIGFDLGYVSANPTSGKFGLVGMSERAGLLQGTCQIVTSPGSGTRVEVIIPISRSPEESVLWK